MENSDIEFPNLGNKNILEEFYELIEKHRLESNNFKLGDFYDYLSKFDTAYQEYNYRNTEISNLIVTKYLTDCLYSFFVIFKFRGFSDRPIFYAFKKFIQFYTLLLDESDGITSEFFFKKNISKNFPSLDGGEYINFLAETDLNFNLINPKNYDEYFSIIDKAEYQISYDFGISDIFSFSFAETEAKKEFFLYVTNFKVIEYNFNTKTNSFEEKNHFYEMTLNIRIDVENNDAQVLTGILFKILSGISNIDNVKLEFEHLISGSVLARVRAYLKDLVAKEETKAVLETAKDIVTKSLSAGQVSHTDTKNKNAETEKLKKEKEKLEKEIDSMPSDIEAKIINALELEKKALENEHLRIKNAKEKIEIIEKLSELTAKGILEADSLKIDINEIMYLLKSGGDIKTTDTDIDKLT